MIKPGLHSVLRLRQRLVLVSDDDFAWFARSALPVRMRNSLDDETKTVKSGMLWSEEYLAPDTILYTLLGARGGGATGNFDALKEALGIVRADGGVLQVGGNETIGQGWLEVIPHGGWS